MKLNWIKYSTVFAYLCIGASIFGQTTQHTKSFNGRWSYIEIAGDSIKPTGLYFMDSLHGVLSCARSRSWWPDYDLHSGQNAVKIYWYRTSDGGNSWSLINFEGADYQDTACNEYPVNFTNLCFSKNNGTLYLGNLSLLSEGNCYSFRKFNILCSEDYGRTWARKSFPIDTSILSGEFKLQGSLSSNTIFLYCRGQALSSGKLLLSTDYGATFPFVKSDKIFEGVTKTSADSFEVTANIRFDNSDFLNWTAIATALTPNCDTPELGCGMTSLVTSNGGASWSKHKYLLPTFENNRITGTPQYVKGTPHLYYFLHNEFSGITREGDINRHGGLDLKVGYHYNSESAFNTSYLYSSDYGKTWTPQHTYGTRRRAFEVVDVENVWMTVCKEDNIYVPERRAGTIVRTTDNGLTWEEDQSTLVINDVGVFDGRIISFSDPRHGWIAANDVSRTYIFRWIADEKTSVRPEVGEEQETFRIKIYPNPAQEETNILLPETRSVARVELFDAMGRKVLIEPKIVNNTASFSTRTISIGCYYVKVTTTKRTTYVRPVLVMR